MYKLNCIVWGDDPHRTFAVNIAQTQTVGDLKDLIKDKTKRQFDLVDAKSLELWKVDLPVDVTIERNLALDPTKSLSPVDEMVEIFPNAPPRKRLHIIIQYPPSVSSGPPHLKLNCIVLGDDLSHAFEIKIAPTESVSALRKAIKDAKKPHFDHVAADYLKLRKVSELMPTIAC
ncbi:hypothetical protein BDR03DRAFT_259861 [Suillus americanus]|nr:hypothetical protein BDR03DRAFT_259861 [Suillus americanus]